MRVLVSLFSYGGIYRQTVEALLYELLDPVAPCSAGPLFPNEDALISRSRSEVLSKFLRTDGDVLVMVDHDIAWEHGDLIKLAAVAHRTGNVVGGLYSLKQPRSTDCAPCEKCWSGYASHPLDPAATLDLGTEQLLSSDSLATGFLAIPATVARAVVATAESEVPQVLPCVQAHVEDGRVVEKVYYDFFRPLLEPRENGAGYRYLSEDYSFCRRVIAAGGRCYIYGFPRLTHYGAYPYAPPAAPAGGGIVVVGS